MTGVDRGDCGHILDLLDFYLDNELPGAETTLVGAHLTGCVRCREEMDSRISMRERLRKAARSAPVPSRLTGKDFLNSAMRPAPAYGRPAWLAIAAAVVLAVSIAGYDVRRLRTGVNSQDLYIAKISGETAPIIQVGLKDHVHCAVFRKFPAAPPSIQEMAAKLGTEYADLIPAVKAQVPADMKVVLAHKCRYHGREYVHLIARGGDHLISLVIANRSEGEAFEGDLKAVARDGHGSFYSAGVREFAIAAFETPEHLVYLISDMDQTRNLHMLNAMAPQIRDVLTQLG